MQEANKNQLQANPELDFYERLASVYHLIFEDWDTSMQEQGKILSRLIPPPDVAGPILDCACGIGTQTLPLAALGYEIEGVDLSASEIERAKQEAAIRRLSINFRQDDMRALKTAPLHHYGTVIALDNALPHLESEEEIITALTTMKERLKNGGQLLLSLRNYGKLMKERPSVTAPKFYQDNTLRRIVHQVWDWQDERHYIVHLYITQEIVSGWKTEHFIGRYRVITLEEVTDLMKCVGFAEIEALEPEETGFYQPIVRGIKPFSG